MTHPQVVILGFDDWLAKQLQEQATAAAWVLRDLRQVAACHAQLAEARPTVFVVQIDFQESTTALLALIAGVHASAPDVAILVVGDVKLPEDDRIAWTLAAFDLGARFVLFPPLARPILEDLVGGLMEATIRRTAPRAAPETIDLAEEGQA